MENEIKHTQLPWVVQRLNHVNDEPWFQIGWIENGNELGPVCEMVGGAVQPTRSFKAVAEFKYLVASEAEIKANAEFIVRACNSHDALIEALKLLVADVQDYEPWQRPCHALDIANAALSLAKEEVE